MSEARDHMSGAIERKGWANKRRGGASECVLKVKRK